MDERPGTVPGLGHGSQSIHPRRPPAHKSVSLRHSPPSKLRQAASTVAASAAASAVAATATTTAPQSTNLSTSPNAPASDKANPPSSVSPRLHLNNHSSGESSDAAGWFERTNNDASHDASFVDTDPPFLLHNSSSSERTPPDGHGRYMGMPSLPLRPNLMNLGTDGSSTEDFRSVIDDLTVANKKLKQRLRKYEKVYDAHLQDEKLFEVRFHGLPDHKKKELEETLRKFAAGLDDSTDRPDISYIPQLNKEVTASSTSRFAESGYVSMSASGQNSSTPSNGPLNQNNDSRKMTKSAYSRQQQSIQSYLHDIPLGLMPQDNAPMSEKAKKKAVVRRLEQIFAGKRSAPGTHSQPMQQEEVAQSAAIADRREREASGRHSRPEGQRTALIMPSRADTEGEEGGATLHIPAQQRVQEQDFAAVGSGSPDQRPTRPLDLDPFRAQVPAANMEYFRHLGFSPPDMDVTAETKEDHGWIYLNLLINMAQLHTLNVTPDNIKDAIAEYSTKLEVSSDGRKIRWKGGHDFSKNSSDGSPEGRLGDSFPEQSAGMQRSPHKSLKTGNSNSTESGYGGSDQRRSRKVTSSKPATETNKFAYKPLFFRRESSEEDVDMYDPTESTSSLFQPQQAGDSSGMGSSNMQSNGSGKRRDDGPMIFYNKARFCTDLTGDRVGASLTLPENYQTITNHPMGAKLNPESSKRSEIWESRGPLDDAAMETDVKSGTGTPSTEGLGFSPADLQNNTSVDSTNLKDFEASGLGGTQPEDNFSIRVQRSQFPAGPTETQLDRRSSLYPSKIQAILNSDDSTQKGRRRSAASPRTTVKQEILSAVRQELPSSVLPPPSFFPFDSASSGEVSDDEESSDDGSDTGDGPSTALQLLNIVPPGRIIASDTSSSSSEASQYSSDDSDDGSIDLLATARQQYPDTIRAFEREYDAAVADRFAEEIAAGSSAATAGGGSGFNSPASHAGEARNVQGQAGPAAMERRGSSRKSARNNAQSSNSESSLSPRSRNLKRARTSESIATVLKSGSGHKPTKSQKTG
ncbi:hypothetical protein E8E13_005473 [Curvularia kusanoi]|uniref:Frequency clock protein n=1 Tax=Curvularia kusanoi TaxID=90978 RepID=A0A9P4T6P8_CURKU|nr:hypothetical protein E8E13_005473 [Curvularia kusanoi]